MYDKVVAFVNDCCMGENGKEEQGKLVWLEDFTELNPL